MTIRYGLIGSGMMGQEHIRNLALLDGCQVTAVADPNEVMRNQAAQLASAGRAGAEVAAFTDYRDLLAADVCDVLVVASPNDAHHDTMMHLLDTPLPILCEKPLCTTAQDCRAVIAKAAGRRAPVWVAMEYRYMAPIQRMLEELATDRAGAPRMISIREHRFPFLHKVDAWNRFNARTGGTLVEKCCHFWDLMRLVLNSDPIRVYASAGLDINYSDEDYAGARPDILDNAYVIVDFANGTRGMLDLCMFAEGSRWQEVVSAVGPKARIDAKVPGPARFTSDGKERPAELEISDRASKVVTRETVTVDESILAAGDHFGSTFFQHQRFLELVRSGQGAPEVSLQDGLWSVLVGEAAERSARCGQAIDLRDMS